jgi:hypothetical protein
MVTQFRPVGGRISKNNRKKCAQSAFIDSPNVNGYIGANTIHDRKRDREFHDDSKLA